MIRYFLMGLFAVVLLSMLAITTYATLDRSIFQVGSQLTSDPWFLATLADAYFGFLTFFIWVAYKEPGVFRKLAWFVLIMSLGNIAMASYMLWQLWRADRFSSPVNILLRSGDLSPADAKQA
jgi:hypothetical protein